MNTNQPFEEPNNKNTYQHRIYQDKLLGEEDYDYSQVEDIAGVDYKKAMILTAIFIGLHFIAKPYLGYLSIIWITLTTGLSVAIWWYFKQYFDAMDDQKTGKFIQAIMGGLVLFGIITWVGSTYVSILDMAKDADKVNKIATTILLLSFIPMAIIFIAGIRIIRVNFQHPFPLKRIAVSAMFILPIYMLFSIVENSALFGELEILLNILMLFKSLLLGGSPEFVGFDIGFFGNLFLMLPYLLLLHHFYRADVEDATP